jgi:hypothetical protein
MSEVYQLVGREVWLTETDGNATCDENQQNAGVDYLSSTFQNTGVAGWTRMFLYVLHTNGNCDHSIVRPDGSNRPAFVTYQGYTP